MIKATLKFLKVAFNIYITKILSFLSSSDVWLLSSILLFPIYIVLNFIFSSLDPKSTNSFFKTSIFLTSLRFLSLSIFVFFISLPILLSSFLHI